MTDIKSWGKVGKTFQSFTDPKTEDSRIMDCIRPSDGRYDCVDIDGVNGKWVKNPEGFKQLEINEKAILYLETTDWYVIRFSETGEAVPEDVTILRQEARESIK